MRRRRLALGVLALLLLGSCTAAGLSLAGGRDGVGAGTVTARADVDRGPTAVRAEVVAPTPAVDVAEPAGPVAGAVVPGAAASLPGPVLGRGSGTVTTAPPSRAVVLQTVLVTLSGSAEGLVPGRRGQVLRVVVGNDAANEDDLLLTLTSVSAVARGPAGSCGPEDLVVTPYRASRGAPTYMVRRGRSVVVPLEVVLVDRLDRDQTDCAGTSFPLTLTATAEVTA